MPEIAVIQPKSPNGDGWIRLPDVEKRIASSDPLMAVYTPHVYSHEATGMNVLSSVDKPTAEPGEVDLGPEYHLSVSRNGQRCTSADAAWVLGQFDLQDAKEDNHVPSGQVRNFWRPVADHLSGYECPCQESEPAMRENKGDFIWRGVPR